jgi:molybdopterin-guanine dinucleotide biosynthesis protein A
VNPGDAAIVILAGGRATRFPGKLEQLVDGEPMLLRVYSNARATGLPVYVAAGADLPPSIAAHLDVPLLTDRWPHGGPLRALLSACEQLAHARVFVVAGDEPRVAADAFETLADAWRQDLEAVVCEHDGRIEPLAALYSRAAVLREAPAAIASGRDAMHALIERLASRRVRVSSTCFVNVNTPEDWARLARTSP